MATEATSEAEPLPVKRHGGRPTLAEAKRRQEHLLDVAAAMFLRHGFGGTSIEAVAEAAGMSKRTLYDRYADKSALFSAVLRLLIERWLVPISRFRSSKKGLDAILGDFGRHLLTSALAPEAIGVYRIITSETERQPEFGRLAYREGRQAAIDAVATVLRRHAGRLRLADAQPAAAQFVSLVIDHSLRQAALGLCPDAAEIDTRVAAAVDLFLNGALRR